MPPTGAAAGLASLRSPARHPPCSLSQSKEDGGAWPPQEHVRNYDATSPAAQSPTAHAPTSTNGQPFINFVWLSEAVAVINWNINDTSTSTNDHQLCISGWSCSCHIKTDQWSLNLNKWSTFHQLCIAEWSCSCHKLKHQWNINLTKWSTFHQLCISGTSTSTNDQPFINSV